MSDIVRPGEGSPFDAAMETWRPIPSFPGYEASDHGQVRSVNRVVVNKNGDRQPFRGAVLRQRLDRYGYFTVKPSGKTRSVHVLVLDAFAGPRPDGMEGCHNDGDHINNRPENLRWDTRQANVADQVAHGVHAEARRTVCDSGHPLAPPNLVRANLRAGWRACLACHRGRSRWRRARARGADVELRSITDACYAEITRPAGLVRAA